MQIVPNSSTVENDSSIRTIDFKRYKARDGVKPYEGPDEVFNKGNITF